MSRTGKSSFLEGIDSVDTDRTRDESPQGELYADVTSYLAISKNRSDAQQTLEALRAKILENGSTIIEAEEEQPESPYVTRVSRGTRKGKHDKDTELQEHYIMFSDGISLNMKQVDRATTKMDEFRAWLSSCIKSQEVTITKL
jgi:hypothetical protein